MKYRALLINASEPVILPEGLAELVFQILGPAMKDGEICISEQMVSLERKPRKTKKKTRKK